MAPVTIDGAYPDLKRVVTGLHSFDRAVGNPFTSPEQIGLPLRTIVEIVGPRHVGKSTFSYFLASRINPKGTIELVDLETFDPGYLKSVMGSVGFEGTVHIIPEYEKDVPRSPADMLLDMARLMRKEEASAGIFDSVSTYNSVAEGEGDIGEAFMGRRAKEIGQFCRKALSALRQPEVTPKAVFVINHAYAKLGGKGTSTAGGTVLEAAKQVSVSLWRGAQLSASSERDDFEIEGRVLKNRFGGIGRKFNLACILNHGIHPGMTALLDCVAYGLATRGASVKIGSKSVGRMGTLLEAAASGDDKKFLPFFDALAGYEPTQKEADDDESE